MQSVVDKVALKRFFSESHGLPVSIIPPMLHTQFITTITTTTTIIINCKCSAGKHSEILSNLMNFVKFSHPGDLAHGNCAPLHIHPPIRPSIHTYIQPYINTHTHTHSNTSTHYFLWDCGKKQHMQENDRCGKPLHVSQT